MSERRHLLRVSYLAEGGGCTRPAAESVGAYADVEMNRWPGHAGGGSSLERIESGGEVLRGDCLLADLELA